MAATTVSIVTPKRDGDAAQFPVAASTKILAGTLVMLNSSGYLVSGADTASCVFAGVAAEEIDNSSGSDGDLYCKVWTKGYFVFALGSAAITDVGTAVYLKYNNEVAKAAGVTNDVPCGAVAQYHSTGKVWVDIGYGARRASS